MSGQNKPIRLHAVHADCIGEPNRFTNQRPMAHIEATLSNDPPLETNTFDANYPLMIERELSLLLETMAKQQLPPDKDMEKVITDNLWELYDNSYLG